MSDNTNTNDGLITTTIEKREAFDGASVQRLVRPLKTGDHLPLHRYAGLDIPLDTLYRWFYEAYSKDDEKTMEQLEMAIEEKLQANAKAHGAPKEKL